jgi:glycosyltransferase involved in cell wall biosynthesis
MIRLAIVVADRKIWTGGYNYLLNLVGVSNQYLSNELCPVLFFSDDADEDDIAPFERIKSAQIVRSPALRARRKGRAVRNAIILGLDPAIQDLLNANRIDVVLETAQFFGWRLRQPVLAWMADFQHRVLRDRFPMIAYWKREIGFQGQIISGRTIMVSSEDARRHCEAFYSNSRGRIHVVRFAVAQQQMIEHGWSELAVRSYGLPERFFFLPNQFWTHKNHECVIRALAILKSEGIEVVVAASGNPLDPRDPDHWDNLNRLVKELNVAENFRMLGMIPTAHVHALTRSCMALINPSMFEGWSTTVEEAKSWGTPLVLSDIPVHHEQAPSGTIFFDPADPNELAAALRTYSEFNCGKLDTRAVEARDDNHSAVRRFALEFGELVARVASGKK